MHFDVSRHYNSALHPSGVAKSSTSFGWGKGGNVTSAGCQVTLCDLIWYVSSRSGDGRPACKLLNAPFTFTFTKDELFHNGVHLSWQRSLGKHASTG